MNWFGWALASAFFAGLTAILAKVGVQHLDSNAATAVRTTVVVVFAWAIVWFTGAAGSLAGMSRKTLVFLVLSGLATGLSWLCYFRALQMGDASKVAPIDKLSLVFVLIFAAVFLKEKLTWSTSLGVALVVTGVALISLKPS